MRAKALREAKQATWHIDKQKGIAYSDPADFKGPRIELPLRPMLGCIGTAPDNHAAIPSSTADNFGGNMDYNGMGAGATVMLPVFEPGALFFLGDGHARQGDGEVVGSAIETSLDVEFSVDLVKGKKINWPRLETQDYIMVLGSSRALNEALQHATTELMRWLMDSYGFDERGASLLLGQGNGVRHFERSRSGIHHRRKNAKTISRFAAISCRLKIFVALPHQRYRQVRHGTRAGSHNQNRG